ncbi:MAG: hypothetical protein KKD28_00465 [Chloroflexi bacterium]|nr:hypothetical protein [Chloroflexota bacterium]
MKAITFLIRLVDPLLATQPQAGEPNSAVTYPFIPGSMIRGALIARYLKGKEIDAADESFQKLFLDSKVRYLNAYPAHPTNQARMLPKPLSWYVPKNEASNSSFMINDFAVESIETDEPYKSPKSGDFCYQTEDGFVQLGSPAVRVTVHNASDNRDRKSEGESQVFRYDALAPGEEFVGVILSEDGESLGNTLKPLLEKGDLLLGGSQTAGYGRAAIIPESLNLDSYWQEYGIEEWLDPDSDEDEEYPQSEKPLNVTTLTCLSDAILPETGEQPEKWLESLVGQKPEKSFRKVRLVGGFNHKWGLPLPQCWALEMGSVFVFPVDMKSKLEDLARDGIGERKAEGFGRLAVDWHTEGELTQRELPLRKVETSDLENLSPDSKALAQRMANRRLQNELDRWLVKTVNDLTKSENAFRGLPSATQLSRARLAAWRAWMKGNLTEITNHFKELTDLTQRDWKGAKLKGNPLQKWIDQQIENRESFSPDIVIPRVAATEAQFDQLLRERTIARLIEGILRRAVKVAKDREGGGNHE